MTKTFKELQDIDQVVGAIYARVPTIKDTKFGYAYKRFVDKTYMPVVREYQDAIGEARLDFALEDPKTKEVIIDRTNSRGYKYTKADLKELIKAEKRIADEFDERAIEVISHYCKTVPPELTEDEVAELKGIIFE